MSKHPIQPLRTDDKGVIRFQENKIVRDLLDYSQARGFGLNEIATRDYDREDRMQLAQLIGYSHSGAGSLSIVTDEVYYAAALMHDEHLSEDKARIQVLEGQLAELREAAQVMRVPMATLLGLDPDDIPEGGR